LLLLASFLFGIGQFSMPMIERVVILTTLYWVAIYGSTYYQAKWLVHRSNHAK
jgi:hypothetical protein